MIGNLEQLLDAIPERHLKASLARRKAKVAISPNDKRRFDRAVARVAEQHGVSQRLILSNAADSWVVGARHALYARLWRDEGWSAIKIATVCQHDRTRVYHGLKKLGLRLADGKRQPR